MKIKDLSYSIQHRKRTLTRLCVLSTIFILTFSVLGLVTHTARAASPPAFTFTNYEIARSWDQSFAGVSCPNPGTNCWNWNGEPNLATARDGTIYAVSENTAFNHPSECPTIAAQLLYTCGGTGAWKSTDRGNHFTTLTSPNTNFIAGNPITLWGGDTHVAVAPAKNLNGQYNVYVVSLEAAGSGLVGVGESTSQDGGQTWSNNGVVQFTNPIANPLVEDRPWVAAYGSTKVCVSVHEGAVIGDVWCSYNSGLTFSQVASALDGTHAWLTAETSIPGAIHIDPNTGYMYVPFSGLASATEAANPVEVACGSTTGITCPYLLHAVYMAVSTNGGLTFTDHTVYVNPNNQVNYGENFIAMAADSAGNLYEIYSDGVSLYYSYSTDIGQTWHGPIQVNQAPSTWAIEPWATAGDPGKLDIVWYGTNGCGAGVTDVNHCAQSANWHVFFAQNLNVFSNPTGFAQAQVTGTNHMGPVCLLGGGCQSYRGLFDDFGVTADPSTGMATIVYDNDMYTPNDSRNLPNPDCTSQYTTPSDPAQQNCVHTDIAHQTSGQGVSHPPCRESDGQGEFQGTNGHGQLSFDRDGCIDGDRDSIDSSNRGDGKDFHSTEIDSAQYDDTAHTMTVVGLGTVNGLPVIFTFVATETGTGTPGLVSFVFSDGYTNTGPLTSGSIILH
jgi:hypothetical protein